MSSASQIRNTAEVRSASPLQVSCAVKQYPKPEINSSQTDQKQRIELRSVSPLQDSCTVKQGPEPDMGTRIKKPANATGNQ